MRQISFCAVSMHARSELVRVLIKLLCKRISIGQATETEAAAKYQSGAVHVRRKVNSPLPCAGEVYIREDKKFPTKTNFKWR